jgi:CheY-like chemotaxis protein
MKSDCQQPRQTDLHRLFPATQSQNPPLVLIVEDHDDTREMLELLLGSSGCHVITAKEGHEALHLAETTRPDLVLLDMKLPGLDGLEITRRLRADPALKDIPIVAVTGLVTPEFQAEAINAGCNYCLAKPIDFAILEELVQVLTRQPIILRSQRSLAARSIGFS